MATDTVVDHDIEELLQNIVEKQTVKRLVIFNDDHHGQEEVAFQIIRACEAAGKPCTPEQAIAIMMEAHTKGQAVVFASDLEKCKIGQAILEAIDLATDIID